MKIFIMGCGIADRGELQGRAQQFQVKPSFRKASTNMKLAYLALEKALREASLSPSDLVDAGFVLGSSYGELNQTKAFLKSWANEGLARPIFFQSSLHNGTLGFLSLELGLKGPSFTVSHQYFTAEKSLTLAMDLLTDGITDLCLVSAVEVMDPDLLPVLEHQLPEGVKWRDSASCVVLASETWVKRHPGVPLAELKSVSFSRSEQKFSGEYNDSDGLEKLIREIRMVKTGSHETCLLKRDFGESRLNWIQS